MPKPIYIDENSINNNENMPKNNEKDKKLDETFNYKCNTCIYCTSRHSSYLKHLATVKHKMLIDVDAKPVNSHQCKCGKEFKHRQGIWRHKQKCTHTSRSYIKDNSEKSEENIFISQSKQDEIMYRMFECIRVISQDKSNQTQLVLELVKQNTDFKELLLEQNKQMMELVKSVGSN
jgi:hypothetical protein